MISVRASETVGAEINADYFGANYLFNFSEDSEEQAFFQAVEELNISSVRFPGGNVTEQYFDISNPNQEATIDPLTGETVTLTPLSDFMTLAETAGVSVGIVLPTRTFLTEETDSNGDRFADIPSEDLTQFVRDLLIGNYGNAEVVSLEIGNEYWMSNGMSAMEYARVATQMTSELKQIFSDFEAEFGVDVDTRILVQSGTNYGPSSLDERFPMDWSAQQTLDALEIDYGIQFDAETFISSAGNVKWMHVNNEIILNEFRDSGQINDIDGVVNHFYSREGLETYNRSAALDFLEDTWQTENPSLGIHVTEWNQKGNTNAFDPQNDYGLRQAHEMLNMLEEMADHNVEQAFAWPVIHNMRNTLVDGFEGETKLTPGGEMFRMMSEELVGTKSIRFQGAETKETEAGDANIDVHGFFDPNKLVLFLASNVDHVTDNFVFLEDLFTDFASVEVSVLGVAEGERPGDTRSTVEIEQLNVDGHVYSDGLLNIELDPYEIAQVVVRGVTWTEEFANNTGISSEMDQIEAEDVDALEMDGEEIMRVLTQHGGAPEFPEEEQETAEDSSLHSDDGDGGMFGELGWLLLLAPLLSAFG